MTQSERQQSLISLLRSHTVSAVRPNHRSRLPIILTTDDKVIEDNWSDNVVVERRTDKVIERPKILTEYIENVKTIKKDFTNEDIILFIEKYYNEVYIQKRKVYVVDKFHYDDRWFPYKYSVDEPQFTFGILQVENMPFNSFEGRRNKKSFVCSLQDLIYHEYCEPFMVFVGGRFINWNCIDVVFDCDDTYLLLYGVENNWYNLMAAAADDSEYGSISIAILPFKVDFLGVEPDMHFDMMYEITKLYLQDSLRVINGRPIITTPAVHDVYECRKMVYPVGAWLYTQLKYYKLGMLSEDRIKRLKKFEIIKTTKDVSGNIISAYAMKFNALDKDSYNKKLYDKITAINKEMYEANAILRFDDNGRLTSDGSNIIALLDGFSDKDTNIISNHTTKVTHYTSYDEHVSYAETSIDNMLFRENYMIFKDGLFIPRCEPRMSIFNSIGFDNPDGKKCDIKVFYHNPIEHLVSHMDHFSYQSAVQYALEHVKSLDGDDERKKYFESCLNCLDYIYTNTNFYQDNYENGLRKVIEYDPMLLAPLHDTDTDSTLLTGEEVNASLSLPYSYETRRGLKIPRHKYENHESYVLIFENGELLKEYSDMIAYPNFFFIPMERDFNDADQIELFWFNKIDNNEIEFHLTQNMIDNMPELDAKWRNTTIFDKYIKIEDLKVFVKYPEDILVYKDLVPRNDNIAFNISYRDDNNDLYLKREAVDLNIDNESDDAIYTAVSSRKFIYQRLYVDQKAFRIVLDKRFRYCDNQKQYMLFINGRRMDEDAFLITIPKYNRPFWGMYLYTAKFVKPTDRIELFYVPMEVPDLNIDKDYSLEEDGYIRFDKTKMDVPFDSKLYMFFINGKKIAPANIIPVDSHTARVNKDMLTTHNLIITPINANTIPEVQTYMHTQNKYSEYDKIIRGIKENELFGYDELDMLLNTYVKMNPEGEAYRSRANVGRIAIINEIVRDFWVTSGFEYNEVPFIYDYQMDNYIPNENSNAIIPALDASQELDIIKNEIRLCLFEHIANCMYPLSDTSYITYEDFIEIGSIVTNITFNWEFINRINAFADFEMRKQTMSHRARGEKEYTDLQIDTESRTWTYAEQFSDDMDFYFVANRGFQILTKLTQIRFVNGIYYGNIDEDSLQHYSWIDRLIGLEPKNGIMPTYNRQSSETPSYTAMVYKDFNNVIEDLGYKPISTSSGIDTNNTVIINNIRAINNNANLNGSEYPVVDEYKLPTDLQRMFNILTPKYQLSPELDLEDYVIGNNNYFVYACPKRLAYSKDNELQIEFIMPDPRSDDIKINCRDDKATPIYTTGNWSIFDHNLLEPLEVMRMIYLGEFEFTNNSGYTETYCVWRSNGFFTRLFENYKFHIKVRYKNEAEDHDDGLGHIIKYNKEIEYIVPETKSASRSIKGLKAGSNKTANINNIQNNTSGSTGVNTKNILFLDDIIF